MRGARNLTLLLLALLALLSGCKKKKPPVPSPQEQAPTITAQPPAEAQPQPEPQPQPEAQPAPSVQPSPTTVTPTKPKPKKRVTHKSQPQPQPPKEDKKAVVKDGGTEGNAQLAAELPPGEVLHQRQTTVQLRAATESSLRGLTRQLSDEEQAMVQQIRSYMQQSRTAESDGDTERAYNLALKAHLLCDELVKR